MERISLSNAAFEGNNNVFVFDDGPETVLVDTGDGTEATRRQLTAALGDLGIAFADVDRIFLTHWHGDHAGLAGQIQAASGAEVYVHPADAPLVEGDAGAWDDLRSLRDAAFDDWGMPVEKRQALRAWLEAHAIESDTPSVTTFEDGETFRVNGHELTVAHRPGHAAGLCVFECRLDGRRDVFCGDAVLPVYTPNVGGADVRVERPLATYLQSLQRIIEADYDRAWPGHRSPIDAPAARAAEIVTHHEERARRVLEAVAKRGPADAWTVSDELFGDLEGIHILHGPGEADAHLEHLARAGELTRTAGRYRLTDETAARLSETDGTRWPIEY
ncbi:MULTISPECIES: MBL fold metallo-hydrolase [Haloarcula]|uniref:MBL fold metallo-hydrolase n=1 Tax=Haloarcula TaxID=2237 RepID=UPI0023EBDD24|nr:MBL fold metallo-hydrolase [Halomicroarcula sp. XH51]